MQVSCIFLLFNMDFRKLEKIRILVGLVNIRLRKVNKISKQVKKLQFKLIKLIIKQYYIEDLKKKDLIILGYIDKGFIVKFLGIFLWGNKEK